MGRVIIKLGGSNNPAYQLYTEQVHQGPAREAGLTVDHYWANGQVGTPTQIAEKIMGVTLVRDRDVVWQDVEDWAEDGVRRWSPAEAEAVAVALQAAGKPFADQGLYLNLSLANNGGYRAFMDRLGLQLWLAAYTDAAHVLLRGGWTRKPVLWQFTSTNIPALRGIYDANLDVNRSGANVWLVAELQRALTKLGFPTVDDNDYGHGTASSVSAFQESAGLVVDGDAGPVTLTVMAQRLAG